MKLEKGIELNEAIINPLFNPSISCNIDDSDGVYLEFDLGGGKFRTLTVVENVEECFIRLNGKTDFDATVKVFVDYVKSFKFDKVFSSLDCCLVTSELYKCFMEYVIIKMKGEK